MTLQEYWTKGELQSGDITFADGRVLNLEENWCRKNYGIMEETTLLEIEQKYGTEGTAFDILGEVINSDNGHIAYRGEGSMGNEGFVAYANENGQLFWLMFLDFSNPFWKIRFDGAFIIAVTELEFTFRIPILAPEKMSCAAINKWDIEYIEAREKEKEKKNPQ